jgi:hypothetical protein
MLGYTTVDSKPGLPGPFSVLSGRAVKMVRLGLALSYIDCAKISEIAAI